MERLVIGDGFGGRRSEGIHNVKRWYLVLTILQLWSSQTGTYDVPFNRSFRYLLNQTPPHQFSLRTEIEHDWSIRLLNVILKWCPFFISVLIFLTNSATAASRTSLGTAFTHGLSWRNGALSATKRWRSRICCARFCPHGWNDPSLYAWTHWL